MTNEKLKELAEKSYNNQSDADAHWAYHAAARPDVVLRLLAEIDRLRNVPDKDGDELEVRAELDKYLARRSFCRFDD